MHVATQKELDISSFLGHSDRCRYRPGVVEVPDVPAGPELGAALPVLLVPDAAVGPLPDGRGVEPPLAEAVLSWAPVEPEDMSLLLLLRFEEDVPDASDVLLEPEAPLVALLPCCGFPPG